MEKKRINLNQVRELKSYRFECPHCEEFVELPDPPLPGQEETCHECLHTIEFEGAPLDAFDEIDQRINRFIDMFQSIEFHIQETQK